MFKGHLKLTFMWGSFLWLTPWFMLQVAYMDRDVDTLERRTGVSIAWGHKRGWQYEGGELMFSHRDELMKRYSEESLCPSR
jgi:hypothetical protein